MSKFNTGDKVLINSTQVAEIEFYDESLDNVRWVVKTSGGTTNVTTGHISQTQIQHLVSAAIGSDEAPAEEPADETEAPDEEVSE